mmetsp:Transcript_64473/g.119952  ORF Transcript_64473/g.119952 Transcript_64473/m.119952 type:complete len:143 (-) Transcript_64473:221-649(-)
MLSACVNAEDPARVVLEGLLEVHGLVHGCIIPVEDRNDLHDLEEECNIGVRQALRQEYVLVVTHDSSFRRPAGPIVHHGPRGTTFPPVPFPEVSEILPSAYSVVSSSPGITVHHELLKRYFAGVPIDPLEATLIIGFGCPPM